MESYQIVNLSASKAGKAVFSNINLLLSESTITGIYGRRDAGKTVLLNTLYKPEGRNGLQPFSAKLVDTGYLLIDKNAMANMRILTRNHDSLSDEDILWYLEKVGISVADTRLVKDYKKSEKVLLALAIIISENPKIIMFDEPFNIFEQMEIIRFNELLTSLKQMNFSILLTSRNLSLIQPICEKIYHLEHGTLIEMKK